MISGVKKFILILLVLSLILLASGFSLFKLAFPEWYFPFFPLLVLIFMLVNSGFIFFFFRFLQRSSQEFIRGFVMSTGIKLLIYLVLILVYVLTTPKSAIPFSVTVSLLYIAYTGYDLYVMLSMLKRKKEKKSFSNQLSN
jgi:hypothetical protein